MLIMERDFAGRQIPGARPYQEDAQAFAALQEDADGKVLSLLAVLADGMGGENAGDFASHCVVETFIHYCLDFTASKEASAADDADQSEDDDVPQMLEEAMHAANKALDDAIEQNIELDGMGTTLLAVVATGSSLHWLSVGDSPLYLYRRGELSQINEDHSMMPLLQQEVEAGNLPPEALVAHPDRNVLRAAIAGDDIDLVDCPSTGLPLEPGDILIVASDGLQTLSEEEIKIRLDRHHSLPADGIARKLLKAVEREKKPRQDNTSVNVICIPDPADPPVMSEEDLSKTRLIRRG